MLQAKQLKTESVLTALEQPDCERQLNQQIYHTVRNFLWRTFDASTDQMITSYNVSEINLDVTNLNDLVWGILRRHTVYVCYNLQTEQFTTEIDVDMLSHPIDQWELAVSIPIEKLFDRSEEQINFQSLKTQGFNVAKAYFVDLVRFTRSLVLQDYLSGNRQRQKKARQQLPQANFWSNFQFERHRMLSNKLSQGYHGIYPIAVIPLLWMLPQCIADVYQRLSLRKTQRLMLLQQLINLYPVKMQQQLFPTLMQLKTSDDVDTDIKRNIPTLQRDLIRAQLQVTLQLDNLITDTTLPLQDTLLLVKNVFNDGVQMAPFLSDRFWAKALSQYPFFVWDAQTFGQLPVERQQLIWQRIQRMQPSPQWHDIISHSDDNLLSEFYTSSNLNSGFYALWKLILKSDFDKGWLYDTAVLGQINTIKMFAAAPFTVGRERVRRMLDCVLAHNGDDILPPTIWNALAAWESALDRQIDIESQLEFKLKNLQTNQVTISALNDQAISTINMALTYGSAHLRTPSVDLMFRYIPPKV